MFPFKLKESSKKAQERSKDVTCEEEPKSRVTIYRPNGQAVPLKSFIQQSCQDCMYHESRHDVCAMTNTPLNGDHRPCRGFAPFGGYDIKD